MLVSKKHLYKIEYAMLKIMLNLLIEVSVLTVPRVSTEYIQTKKNPLQNYTHPQEILIFYYYLQTTPLAARNTRNKGENRLNPFSP